MDPSRPRTRAQAQGGVPPPPPVPELDRYDPEAGPFERRYKFPIHTKRQFLAFQKIYKRQFENTRFVDLSAIEELGVLNQFLELTSSVGITPSFWTHCYQGYHILTMEFLSSLRLVNHPTEGVGSIQFNVRGERYYVTMDDLSRIFGTEPGCLQIDLDQTGTDAERDIFWTQIARYSTSSTLGLQIEHPVLRVLHRALSSTVFARGETMRRAIKEELLLMRLMLRPNPMKICIAKVIVDHWLDQVKQGGTGAISMCGLATLVIQRVLGPQFVFPDRPDCTAWFQCTLDKYREIHFIQFVRAPGGRRMRWTLRDRPDILLPYPHQVDRSDPTTWLIPLDYVEGGAAPLHQQDPAHMQTDIPEGSRARRRQRTDTAPGPSGTSDSVPHSSMEHITGLLQTILADGRARDRRQEERDRDIQRRLARIEGRVDTLYHHERHHAWLYPPTSDDDDSGDDGDDGPPHDGAGPSHAS